MSFLNSKHGINPKDAIEAANNQRKVGTLFSAFKNLDGAGNYAIIFPVANYGTEEEPFYALITATSTVAKLNLTMNGKKKIGSIVYDETMLEQRNSVDEPPIDKTSLRGLRSICTLFRLGQMEEEIARCQDKFAKQSNIAQSELDNEIRLIKSKYIYDKTLKTQLIDDIIGRPRDVVGTICYVIKLDNNNKPYLNADGTLDPNKCKLATYMLSNKRNQEFIDSLKIPSNFIKISEIEGTPVYATETIVVYKGVTDESNPGLSMKDLKFNCMQVGRLIDNPQIKKSVVDNMIFDPDQIYHKSSNLSRGWTIDKAESEVRALLSENQVYMTYAKTDTKAFKYAAKALAETDIFGRISNSDIIVEAKKQSGVVSEAEAKVEEVAQAKEAQSNTEQTEALNGEDLFSLG